MFGYTGTFESSETTSYDGLGNILAATNGWGFSTAGGSTANTSNTTNAYTGQNRLSTRVVVTGGAPTRTTGYSYDPAGNTVFEATSDGSPNGTAEERAAFYGADDRLVASDLRVSGRRAFEEYRYDPLGRRIWVSTTTSCAPVNAIECFTSAVRRTVWEGDREVAEIQAPIDPTTSTVEELDTGFPVQPYNPAAGSYGDPNPFFGRVVYAPGLAIDQPMSVTRYEYRDKPGLSAGALTWPRFTLMPFWNYRGAAGYGLFSDGAWAKPYAAGGTSCPLVGDQSTQRCVLLQWAFTHSAYDKNRGKVKWPSWHGSILKNKQDGTGLEYMRNRVYDPGTGRFTQEDPIGLAGGLNLYGFANGDPVNFSDPFGLSACPPDCEDGGPSDASAANWQTWGGPARAVVGELASATSKVIGGALAAEGLLGVGEAAPVVAGRSAGVAKAAYKFLFGKGSGLLNSNRYLRIGEGVHGGRKVFRISGKVVTWVKENGHIDLKDLGPWGH